MGTTVSEQQLKKQYIGFQKSFLFKNFSHLQNRFDYLEVYNLFFIQNVYNFNHVVLIAIGCKFAIKCREGSL